MPNRQVKGGFEISQSLNSYRIIMKDKGLRFLIFMVLTAAWLMVMRTMTAPLDSGLIIDFEYIGTASNAISFLAGLRDSGQLDLLTRSIFLDFIFPLLYGATFYYATAWICHKLPKGHMFNRFRDISILTFIAVLCDYLENLSLIKLIYYPPEDIYAYLAYFFAATKFTLLGIVLAHFIISGLIVVLESKKGTPAS
ncbi:hypothetical protein [Daejeonella lutea]|uniref:Uncharacterized protein n=1 Tax=Daejeonella lutea TaxID=572036 RepID=A0A1T5EFU4_9SPHI|nr:hypothetical protein [Daejeonella lutea]SKB82749.1 hypothetical protein SAMN05661099_2966 [Daejeonella lutea]